MASARVEQLLEEIGRLSPEDQSDLARNLPRVLRPGREDGARLSTEAVRQALEIRERIRQRLATEGRTPGSISADVDREGL